MKIKQLFQNFVQFLVGKEISTDENLLGYQVTQVDLSNYFIRIYRETVTYQRFGVKREHNLYRVSRFNENKTRTFRVLDDNDYDVVSPTPEMVVQQFLALEAMEQIIAKNMVVQQEVPEAIAA